MRIRLKYVNEYRDRHGVVRRYFRRPGQPAIALPGAPGSREFMEVYNAALAQLRVREIGKGRSVPGTINAAIAAYYTHNKFLALADSTRKMRRAVLERFRADHGGKRIATLMREHVVAILGKQNPSLRTTTSRPCAD
jgi:hypothetical protein